jgi:hypothetical protein
MWGSHGNRVLESGGRFPGPSEIKIPPLLDLDSRVTVADAMEEHHPMPTKDGFDPAHPLPWFLADQAEQGIGNALDGAAPTSRIFKARIFKASILIVAATAIGIAVLAAGDPMALLAWGSATLVGNSSQSTPTIQAAADTPALIPSTTDAQVVPPTTRDAPVRDEIAASEPAVKDQTENSELATEALFRQFQAWAAERKAQARGEPVQPVQDAPAQVVQDVAAQDVPAKTVAENVRAPNRLVQKRRQVRFVHNARAEMRTQNLRKQVRRAERARAERPPVQAERPPVQDARAQDTSVQNAPPLPFLFGQRN